MVNDTKEMIKNKIDIVDLLDDKDLEDLIKLIRLINSGKRSSVMNEVVRQRRLYNTNFKNDNAAELDHTLDIPDQIGQPTHES